MSKLRYATIGVGGTLSCTDADSILYHLNALKYSDAVSDELRASLCRLVPGVEKVKVISFQFEERGMDFYRATKVFCSEQELTMI